MLQEWFGTVRFVDWSHTQATDLVKNVSLFMPIFRACHCAEVHAD